ncbi:transglutaminase TgpA family protein [Noviherbaspirillum galbum]|uniref:DUF3488 domain-containing transglutaminase family protein n=1 Tax=Noviherbaspirillum galbum TaxID=2709383 RepID=A0A6B3SIT1_9BURK|nr:DUF3488 and transglutaminase-like domain-containing protein [Noviherbaspirillum galbum]NEX60600.1 DUF3488 domain-containing transglutaminase family protein [Noviherbaspirillum galbum]
MSPAAWLRTVASRPMTRDKSNMLLMLAACTAVILPHLLHLPWWVAPACGAALLWRGWITFRGLRMPPRTLLLLLSLSCVAGVLLSYRNIFGRDVGLATLTLMLTLKLLEMHARRDLYVALFLGFFLTLAQFFHSQSIGAAAWALFSIVLILLTQQSWQYTGAVPPLATRLRQAATIVVMAAPLMLVLFVLFPRIQGPLWGMPGGEPGSRTGLSDDMSPGNIARLAESDEIAFRVRFTGPPPARSDLYWRGPVLGVFDGHTWTAPPARVIHSEVKVSLRGRETRYEVTLEPHGKPWLFALDLPRMLPYLPGNPSIATPELQLLASRPINERVRYEIGSHTNYTLQADESLRMQAMWLQLPARTNPRAQELARTLREQHATPSARINAVLAMFREQGFRYTLEPPPLGNEIVDDFLFNTRAGFCEHYASAFVFLARAMGIPARVVTGYQGGEMNQTDGYMAVRQSDAHAWAEAWLEGAGWMRIDPTSAVSPQRVERSLRSAIPQQVFGGMITLDERGPGLSSLRRMRQQWEAVGNAWNQWVLNYSPEKQKQFLDRLGLGMLGWQLLSFVIVGAAALAVLLVLLPSLLRQRKRDPVQEIYEQFCKRLARRGQVRAPHEGPREFAARLLSASAALPGEKKEALSRFLQLYETVRYGTPDAIPPSYLSQLKRLSNACR